MQHIRMANTNHNLAILFKARANRKTNYVNYHFMICRFSTKQRKQKKKNHFKKAANKYGNNTATTDTGADMGLGLSVIQNSQHLSTFSCSLANTHAHTFTFFLCSGIIDSLVLPSLSLSFTSNSHCVSLKQGF